jgi:hypothetical protein
MVFADGRSGDLATAADRQRGLWRCNLVEPPLSSQEAATTASGCEAMDGLLRDGEPKRKERRPVA